MEALIKTQGKVNVGEYRYINELESWAQFKGLVDGTGVKKWKLVEKPPLLWRIRVLVSRVFM